MNFDDLVGEALASLPTLPSTTAELKGPTLTRVRRHAASRRIGESEALAELRVIDASQKATHTASTATDAIVSDILGGR